MTSDLPGRVSIHKQDFIAGFTKRYGVHVLVYYQYLPSINEAIAREKTLKTVSRAEKMALIEARHPEWADLYPEIADWGT